MGPSAPFTPLPKKSKDHPTHNPSRSWFTITTKPGPRITKPAKNGIKDNKAHRKALPPAAAAQAAVKAKNKNKAEKNAQSTTNKTNPPTKRNNKKTHQVPA